MNLLTNIIKPNGKSKNKTELSFPINKSGLVYSKFLIFLNRNLDISLKSLSKLIKSGGRFLFYVYKRKGPIREFTDDYIREVISKLSYENAWKSLEPLTQLGIDLGKLNIELDINKPIDVIPIN